MTLVLALPISEPGLMVLAWPLNICHIFFDHYGPVNPCKFSTSLHLYHRISHISCGAILWLLMVERAPPLHHHPFAGHQFPKLEVFPHHFWLQQFSLAAIWKKNRTRLLQPPPHHGAYSSILASELVAKWKHNENLRLAGTFRGRSWQCGGLKSRVWKRNYLMANQ